MKAKVMGGIDIAVLILEFSAIPSTDMVKFFLELKLIISCVLIKENTLQN